MSWNSPVTPLLLVPTLQSFLLHSRMAPSSAASPSCTYEGGSATWRVPGRVRAEPILGSASWKGWLGSSQVPILGGMCVGRPQPKESPHSSGGGLHHNSGSDHREALPAFASGKPTGDVVGSPTFCTPAPPPMPQLILIPPEVLPLQGLRVRGQADLKTYSCEAFQSNESDRASDMSICCSSFYTEIQKLLKVYFNKANSYFTYRSFKSKIQNVEFQFESVVTSHTSKAATPGHTKDTHTHTRTHMRFGETPLPSAAPGITSVQSKVVLRTQHPQGDYTNSFTQSHSPWRRNYKMSSLIEKNRLESDS